MALQCIIHLNKGFFSLGKEAKHNGAAKIALIFVVIHLQDLLEGEGVDAVTQIRQSNRTLFTLEIGQSNEPYKRGACPYPFFRVSMGSPRHGYQSLAEGRPVMMF